MKVLVTGGAGFIGSHIVEALLEQNFEVVVIDYALHSPFEGRNVRFYRLDVRSNLNVIFSNERPDYVIHQSAQISVSKSMRKPVFDGAQNILATINVLKMCVTYGVKKIIFASSAAVYGHPNTLLIDESHDTKPLSFYGLSKLQAEAYIQFFAQQYKLDYTILRYANVFGPGQSVNGEAGVIAIFMNQIINGESPTIFGDGTQTRDFVFVKDVAKANLAALADGKAKIINVSSGVETSIIELLQAFQRLGYANIFPIFSDEREGDIHRSSLSNHLAYQFLDWSPMYTLIEGLQETTQFYKRTEEVIKSV